MSVADVESNTRRPDLYHLQAHASVSLRCAQFVRVGNESDESLRMAIHQSLHECTKSDAEESLERALAAAHGSPRHMTAYAYVWTVLLSGEDHYAVATDL